MTGFLWPEHGRSILKTICCYVFIVFVLVSNAYCADLFAFFHTPSSNNLITFEDRGLGLLIKYPSNWERLKVGQDQVTFIAPRERDSTSFPAGLGIKSHNVTFPDSTLDSIANEVVADLERDTQDFTLLSSHQSRLDNLDAYEIPFAAIDDNDAKRMAMQIIVQPENLVYVITYKAYPEEYESYLPIIRSMLDSLKFL